MNACVRMATADDLQQLARIPAAALFLTNQFLVAISDRVVIAYLVWHQLAPGECEILQLETLPPFRRHGFARRLLRTLKIHAPGDLFLEVRDSNLPARQLYVSEGFTQIGRRREYYSSPVEDGIVLRFHPC